jgi:NADPH2:quinone reductase
MKTIVFEKTGGPDVLQVRDSSIGQCNEGEALVEHAAIGIDFIDAYHRSGLYPVASLPSGIGMEAAGVVAAIGPGVDAVTPGDRVMYAAGPPGAYAEARILAADRLVKIPDGIEDKQAAAMALKGLTVEYLIRRTYAVKAGQTVLWHAAAGGVGLIACQWLRSLGVTIIGTVGSDKKAEVATECGCTHTIVYTREDFVTRVGELTNGRGVDVVYDSVGKDTFLRSLDCVVPRGLIVTFGNASGKPPNLDLSLLQQKGCLYVTRPSLFPYIKSRNDLLESAAALFERIESGAVKVQIGGEWRLEEAAEAHRAMESRSTTGSLVLMP